MTEAISRYNNIYTSAEKVCKQLVKEMSSNSKFKRQKVDYQSNKSIKNMVFLIIQIACDMILYCNKFNDSEYLKILNKHYLKFDSILLKIQSFISFIDHMLDPERVNKTSLYYSFNKLFSVVLFKVSGRKFTDIVMQRVISDRSEGLNLQKQNWFVSNEILFAIKHMGNGDWPDRLPIIDMNIVLNGNIGSDSFSNLKDIILKDSLEFARNHQEVLTSDFVAYFFYVISFYENLLGQFYPEFYFSFIKTFISTVLEKLEDLEIILPELLFKCQLSHFLRDFFDDVNYKNRISKQVMLKSFEKGLELLVTYEDLSNFFINFRTISINYVEKHDLRMSCQKFLRLQPMFLNKLVIYIYYQFNLSFMRVNLIDDFCHFMRVSGLDFEFMNLFLKKLFEDLLNNDELCQWIAFPHEMIQFNNTFENNIQIQDSLCINHITHFNNKNYSIYTFIYLWEQKYHLHSDLLGKLIYDLRSNIRLNGKIKDSKVHVSSFHKDFQHFIKSSNDIIFEIPSVFDQYEMIWKNNREVLECFNNKKLECWYDLYKVEVQLSCNDCNIHTEHQSPSLDLNIWQASILIVLYNEKADWNIKEMLDKLKVKHTQKFIHVLKSLVKMKILIKKGKIFSYNQAFCDL